METYTIRSAVASAPAPAKKHNLIGASDAKLEKAEVVRVKLLSVDSVRTLQNYRREQSLTQKQLDQRCSFPVNTISNLESRRAGPTVGQLRDLNRITKLGLTLE